ncbi:LOW QUALITY PROTEIN: Hypothetical protein PHPALM_13993 [Phytophthora palmivora]|uniref:MULE transposase domain-containing protein n=1 Tax=Phytophthora palmivora TaxID=4796 RepID=A0A2P4XVW6_9STRA|nr:LOW QUALITY PROTEIN: Hypothetical protein PHPALM_13993 [Phytophthora palmivora]
MEAYLSTIFQSGSNDRARCKFDHVTNATDANILIKHNLHPGVVMQAGGLHMYLSAFIITLVKGQHTMQDPDAPSPKSQHFTSQIRTFIEERPGEDASIKPLDLFAWLIIKVDNGVFRGLPPKVLQVQAYVKRLRKNNKRDAMKPVLERCASHKYDISESIALAEDRLVILCDVKHETDMLVPNLGTESSHSPFQIPLREILSIGLLLHISTYRFIMTDVDNAQFNAFSSQLPDSKILMCWFHVCQNVKDHISKTKLAPVTINMIFRDMNNLHFARTEEVYLSKRAHITSYHNGYYTQDSPVGKRITPHQGVLQPTIPWGSTIVH